MRFLSMIRINENSGLAPSEQLMQETGKLIDEMTRTMQDAIELTRRFLKVHGDEWDVECEVRQIEAT